MSNNIERFDVGDDVAWGSGAVGKVIAVVREDDWAFKCVPTGYRRPVQGYGRPLKRLSYLVAATGCDIARWPRPGSIRRL